MGKRNVNDDPCAAALGGIDAHRATAMSSTLSHPEETQRQRLYQRIWMDANAVILDLQSHAPALRFKSHYHAFRRGMPRDIGQRFLADVEKFGGQ